MKNSIKKISKSILSLVLAFSLCLGAFLWLKSNKTTFAEYQATVNYSDNFSSESTWTQSTNLTGDSSEVFSASYAKINLKESFPAGFVAPSERSDGSSLSGESSADDYALGLFANAAPVETGADNTPVYNRFSKSISGLAKNSYYAISFSVFAKGASASVKLTGSISYETPALTDNSSWVKYYIFVSTPVETYSTLTVNLNLGSFDQIAASGPLTAYVLFDDFKIETISEKDFNNQTISSTAIPETSFKFDSNASRTVDISSSVDAEFSTLSLYKDFEESADYVKATANSYEWHYYAPGDLTTLSKSNYKTAYSATNANGEAKYFNAEIATESDEFITYEDDGVTPIPVNTFSNNNKALKLTNKTSDLSLGLASRSFTISQFQLYRISVMAKSSSSSSTASLMVISNIKTGAKPDGANFSQTRTLSPFTTSQSVTNNWSEIVLYVRGNALNDVSSQIVLLAGKNSVVYFDHIKVQKITSSEYSLVSSTYALDLSPTSALQTDSVSNGHFNFGSITEENINAPYLFAPNNFSATNSNYADVKSGIVPSNSNLYYDSSLIENALGTVANPIISGPKVNMLAIYSPSIAFDSEKTYSYLYSTNSTFSLSSAKTYVLSFDAYAANTASTAGDFSGNMLAKLTFNSNTIVDFDYDLTNTGNWATYKVIIRTGSCFQNVKILKI